jgi:hypothetical protein
MRLSRFAASAGSGAARRKRRGGGGLLEKVLRVGGMARILVKGRLR